MLIGMVGMVLLEVEMRIRMCVREVRESFGISQPGLSLMSGVSQPALSRIERNLREPRLGTLVRLARSLGVSELDLYVVDDDLKNSNPHTPL